MSSNPSLTLDSYLNFRNGKTTPERDESGIYPVFGSNGLIGYGHEPNAEGPMVVIGRVGSYCGSLRYSRNDAWVTDNAIVCTSKNRHDARYWYFALGALDLNGRSSGSGQPLLNQKVLGSIPFTPPSEGQRLAIAEVLGALDDKIAANFNLAATGEELAISSLFGEPSMVPLREVVRLHRNTVSPESIGEARVDHFSLPAFDAGALPTLDSPRDIKSAKFRLDRPVVLLSKLNPRFPRVWNVESIGVQPALASTEFLVLEPRGSTTAALWAALSQPAFSLALDAKVAGTSGSHQRVSSEDALDTLIIDPRAISRDRSELVANLISLAGSARRESRTLAETRDALLPRLMSGKLRVKDAEKVVEGVL